MLKNALVAIAIITMIVSIGSAVWPFPDTSQTYSGTPESIMIGNTAYENSALLNIADDQGYFAKCGLNVIIRNYDSGGTSISDMKNGVTDISISGEYSIVAESLNKENISIIGSIDKYQNVFLICRKDRGIKNISNLKGRIRGRFPWLAKDKYSLDNLLPKIFCSR